MVTNKRFNLKRRRRRAGRTNYRRRLELLKSRKPRLVIRRSNKSITAQVIEYAPDGDIVKASASAAQLTKLGWKHSTKSIPAAYLAGYLAGSQAKKAKITEAVVDIGMQKPTHGGRLFAAAKGAVDAGLNIAISESAIPKEERLEGSHINDKLKADIKSIKEKA